VISEVAARPPGAQFLTIHSYAHDFDFYRAWAALMVHDEWVQPPERRYAVGAVYLRARGTGRRVSAVLGIDEMQRELGEIVVEARLPKTGEECSSSYEGEGYVILRHPRTETVKAALKQVVGLLRVEAS
jgi:hypothetical protein